VDGQLKEINRIKISFFNPPAAAKCSGASPFFALLNVTIFYFIVNILIIYLLTNALYFSNSLVNSMWPLALAKCNALNFN
jgi:hypothetical protein